MMLGTTMTRTLHRSPGRVLPVRLGLDVTASTAADGGIGRYVEELTRALLEQARAGAGLLEDVVLFTGGDPPSWCSPGDPGAVRWPASPGIRVERYRRYGHPAFHANVFLGPAVARSGVQVFHSADTLGVPLTSGRGVAVVATVHDLIPWKFPQAVTAPHRIARRITLPLVVRRADRLIADSQATARDLIELFPDATDKVRVVPLGVSDRFAPASRDEVAALRSRFGLPARYLLSVGTLSPRKNLGGIFEAYARLSGQGVDIPPLVVAGKPGWLWEPVLGRIAALGLQNRIRVCDFVPDADLPALLTGAAALLLPSLYEGFGLPVLEAMTCGTPVLTSRCSALAEVSGEAALLVDPHNPGAIAEGIRRLLDDTAYRDELVHRGLIRARAFSWAATARQTLAVYQEALEARRTT
jgi:glycosyltransferase involved in cell wall biosynthesis